MTRYFVDRGQKVQQGQKIGELGTTGYSTGPHLHFSIFKNGDAVDPLRFLK
jgi:murein DD-endopeptidase MepM/ murein hydrolase activator NlpD